MASSLLASQLPDIYKGLLPAAFLRQEVVEKTADCSNCYMCRPERAKQFEPSTKCCTYYPFIPNYLVGGMLKENQLAGDKMRELLRQRQWILPIGVVAPPSYQVKHQNKHADEFGRNPDLMCPFYKSQSGQCSVWKWRDSQCSTYFCTYDNPKTGAAYWLGVQQFLYDVEMNLAQECMIQKGFTNSEIESNLKWVRFTEGRDEIKPYSLSSLDWSRFWQHHHDQIELYFIECYNLVVSSSAKYKTDIEDIYRRSLGQ